MQTDKSIEQAILALKRQGLSSRQISKSLFGTTTKKSTVNDILKRNQQLKRDDGRMLFLDIESAATLGYFFDRKNIFVSQENIVTEGGWLLSFCYSWSDEDTVHRVWLTPEDCKVGNDYALVVALYEILQQADAVVAHYGDGFDLPMFRARCLYHGLPPAFPVKQIDTYKMASKHFKLPNNKLDSIASFLGLGRKVQTGGIRLWIECQQGNEKAMAEMVDYCAHDVKLLRDIYYRLAPWGLGGSNFNAGILNGNTSCYVCGSLHLKPLSKITYTGVGQYDTYRCGSCGAINRDRRSTSKVNQSVTKLAITG